MLDDDTILLQTEPMSPGDELFDFTTSTGLTDFVLAVRLPPNEGFTESWCHIESLLPVLPPSIQKITICLATPEVNEDVGATSLMLGKEIEWGPIRERLDNLTSLRNLNVVVKHLDPDPEGGMAKGFQLEPPGDFHLTELYEMLGSLFRENLPALHQRGILSVSLEERGNTGPESPWVDELSADARMLAGERTTGKHGLAEGGEAVRKAASGT